jgi:hypothetical protein
MWRGRIEEFLYTIRDFVSLYIFTITLNIFPFILLSSNLCVLFLNDLETFLETCDVEGLKTVSSELKDKLNLYLKLFIILYADDTVIMPFCQIGLVDNLSKDWILPSFKTSYIAFVPLWTENIFDLLKLPLTW